MYIHVILKASIILSSFLITVTLVSCSNESSIFFEYESEKPLKEVLEDAEFAITEENFRITGNLHIGKGIQERENADFPQYEMILFCNLSYAQEMLTIDPSYVNYCPHRISIREHKQKIIIGTILLPEKTANRKMNNFAVKLNSLLRDIVKYAAEEDPFLLYEDDDV
jgi:uncharacterized protein (DUF302 family)